MLDDLFSPDNQKARRRKRARVPDIWNHIRTRLRICAKVLIVLTLKVKLDSSRLNLFQVMHASTHLQVFLILINIWQAQDVRMINQFHYCNLSFDLQKIITSLNTRQADSLTSTAGRGKLIKFSFSSSFFHRGATKRTHLYEDRFTQLLPINYFYCNLFSQHTVYAQLDKTWKKGGKKMREREEKKFGWVLTIFHDLYKRFFFPLGKELFL